MFPGGDHHPGRAELLYDRHGIFQRMLISTHRTKGER